MSRHTLAPSPDPQPELIGVPSLAGLAFAGGDLSGIADELLARMTRNPFDAHALMDSAIVLLLLGRPQESRAMKALAIQTQQLYHYPRPFEESRVRVLAIYGPGDLMANSPLEFLVEDQPVALDLLFVTPEQGLPKDLPEHDVLIVAVAESDQNQPLLARLAQALANWPRPVLNWPQRISSLSRDSVCQLLGALPGIVVPPTLRVQRSELQRGGAPAADAHALPGQLPGLRYPLIVRPVDSHAGSGLDKLESSEQLANYLDQNASQQFFVSNFVDYRSPDGCYRKYRIVLIDGVAHLAHLAVSTRWMVHYLNADMLVNAEHRAEEARCMQNFASGFAKRHAQAIAAIHQALGLEYVGIDCAETPDGQLLVFEVDSNMVVHNMDPAAVFPYKKIWMPRLFGAFTEMLVRRAAACGRA